MKKYVFLKSFGNHIVCPDFFIELETSIVSYFFLPPNINKFNNSECTWGLALIFLIKIPNASAEFSLNTLQHSTSGPPG